MKIYVDKKPKSCDECRLRYFDYDPYNPLTGNCFVCCLTRGKTGKDKCMCGCPLIEMKNINKQMEVAK